MLDIVNDVLDGAKVAGLIVDDETPGAADLDRVADTAEFTLLVTTEFIRDCAASDPARAWASLSFMLSSRARSV